jgi:hypothetical protein
MLIFLWYAVMAIAVRWDKPQAANVRYKKRNFVLVLMVGQASRAVY